MPVSLHVAHSFASYSRLVCRCRKLFNVFVYTAKAGRGRRQAQNQKNLGNSLALLAAPCSLAELETPPRVKFVGGAGGNLPELHTRWIVCGQHWCLLCCTLHCWCNSNYLDGLLTGFQVSSTTQCLGHLAFLVH
ncbi:hypothetical protein BT63DRAFT_187084 [Microthyrium microscopicum]|uniref:Uncharacterized protein n=1 Tax=Microthyrium microscopicum TaxID=703497 RepID=A0A6A6UJX9_9PEZI|nr:hypothetical protein BT63DRAFT_187084 [Microthyrium microscopicum]